MNGKERGGPTGAIDDLSAAVRAFCDFVEGLPQEALAEKAWGPKQVLAHLVLWYEQYLAQLEARSTLRVYRGSQGRQDELNAQAVAASRGVPVEQLLRRLQPADERLGSLALALDPQDSLLEVYYKSGRWRCTLDDALARMEAHVRGHLREAGFAGLPIP